MDVFTFQWEDELKVQVVKQCRGPSHICTTLYGLGAECAWPTDLVAIKRAKICPLDLKIHVSFLMCFSFSECQDLISEHFYSSWRNCRRIEIVFGFVQIQRCIW